MRKNSLEIIVIAVIIIVALIAVILYFGHAIGDVSSIVTGTISGELRSGSSQQNLGNEDNRATESKAAAHPYFESKQEGTWPNPHWSITEDDIPVPPDGGDMPSVIPSGL